MFSYFYERKNHDKTDYGSELYYWCNNRHNHQWLAKAFTYMYPGFKNSYGEGFFLSNIQHEPQLKMTDF